MTLRSKFVGIVVHTFCEPRGLKPEYLKLSQEYATSRIYKNSRLLLPTDKIIAEDRGSVCNVCHALFLPWDEVCIVPYRHAPEHYQKEVMPHPLGSAAAGMIDILTKRLAQLETRLAAVEKVFGAVVFEEKFPDSGGGGTV